MDYELISQTALFQGCSPSETEKLLHGLKTFTKKYKKGLTKRRTFCIINLALLVLIE